MCDPQHEAWLMSRLRRTVLALMILSVADYGTTFVPFSPERIMLAWLFGAATVAVVGLVAWVAILRSF